MSEEPEEITVVTVPADPNRHPILRSIKRSDVDTYRKFVGGHLECITIGDPEGTVYCNEEGMLGNLPVNTRAEAVVGKHRPHFLEHNQIRGDVIFCGPPDHDGEDTDVPDAYINELGAKPLSVPHPPEGSGYDWFDELRGTGWYEVALWGREGYNLGSWPFNIIAFYDGPHGFGVVTNTEGDMHLQVFETEQEREEETNKIAIHFWEHYEVQGAPRKLSDGRLGPYKGQ